MLCPEHFCRKIMNLNGSDMLMIGLWVAWETYLGEQKKEIISKPTLEIMRNTFNFDRRSPLLAGGAWVLYLLHAPFATLTHLRCCYEKMLVPVLDCIGPVPQPLW